MTDAINDTLKAIAASLLMEQVLAPRFNFVPRNSGPMPDFEYGEGGYQYDKGNIGFDETTGEIQIEIKGLVMPESHEGKRICREDLNEVITAFVQDKVTLERGMFDTEMVPEELTQVRMGKIVKDKYPDLSANDQEAVRQRAIAALSITQMASGAAAPAMASGSTDESVRGNTALLDGVRKFAMDVRDLDIDMIDRINPFVTAYAILAKSMSEDSLKQVAAVIAGRNIALSNEEARMLAERALAFKKEKGRLPSITSPDPWERKMAEGVAFLARQRAKATANV